jgi:hypothetical protein
MKNGHIIIRNGRSYRALDAIFNPHIFKLEDGSTFNLPRFKIKNGDRYYDLPKFKRICSHEDMWIYDDEEYSKVQAIIGEYIPTDTPAPNMNIYAEILDQEQNRSNSNHEESKSTKPEPDELEETLNKEFKSIKSPLVR